MQSEKYKVLLVTRDLSGSGMLSWLFALVKYIDKRRFQIDFLVRDASNQEAVLQARRLGAEVHCIPGSIEPFLINPRHMFRVRRFMKEHGPYHVLHCHEGIDSVPYLTAASLEDIPIRIVHAHSSFIRTLDWFSPPQTMLRFLKRTMIRRYATHGFVSRPHIATALFGRNWTRDGRWRIFFCGIDFTPFEREPEVEKTRSELGIPQDAFVLGHVGRFSPSKNHDKIIGVFSSLCRKRPDARLLLVGDGELRASVETKVRRYGLHDRVIFTGTRADVPRLMQDAMDVFIFAPLYEGLGTAFLEAQAAGLPCVISEGTPKFNEVVREHLVRIGIDAPDADWADAVIKAARLGRVRTNRRLFSRFDVAQSIGIWENLYATGVGVR